MKKLANKPRIFTTTRVMVLGFLAIILVGSALLMLPFATKAKGSLPFIDALFTATSATCVTGLASVDTFATYTIFGQIVILLLIQIGGIGFMGISTLVYLSFARKITLSMRLAMNTGVAEGNVKIVKTIARRILIVTFTCEGVGAIILSGAFSRYMGAGEAIWNGIFHSISAFCNAGFDIMHFTGEPNLIHFHSDPLVLLTISALIIVGGIGFIVVGDIWDNHRWRKLELHTKVVLLVTLALLVLGTVFFFGAEYNNPDSMKNMSFGEKLLNAFFQSVTTRTAGFMSIDNATLSPVSRAFTMVLMFIGASPGSTGGGVKTTTLFILLVLIINVLRQKKQAVVDKRTISQTTLHKASAVFTLAMFISVVSLIGLLIFEGDKFGFEQLMFEQVSAYATVGLSLGITSSLSVMGKLIIITNMFVGRVGVLTFMIAFFTEKKGGQAKIVYPECTIEV